MMREAQLTGYGGTGSVTGANFLLELGGMRILIDCGLRQDTRYCHDCNYEPFPYAPESIDMLFATHAHADHIGRIPKLVKEGFRGAIYSTPATRDLAAVMFDDATGILADEARAAGREPLYTKEDARRALALWQVLAYHAPRDLGGGVSVRLRDAGHILGSAILEFSAGGTKIVMTGDLGNSPAPLVRDTEKVTDATYLVMESVYGDRNHESRDERSQIFGNIVKESIARGGTLLIPSFSIDRTQVLLYELNELVESGEIEPLPVFLDSPLAIAVTDIYRRYARDLNETAREKIAAGDDIFDFSKFSATARVEDSRAILSAPNPKIVIAGSGMSAGGRILEHERQYLRDPQNTFLLVGYQVAGSFGRRIQDGAKEVTIAGARVPVRATVRTISGYSAHKDSDNLIAFVADTRAALKKVFVAMGEPKSSLFLVQRLRDYLGVNAILPEPGIPYRLEL